MEISIRDFKRCSMVSVTGRIDGSTQEEFESTLNALMEQSKCNLVMDLNGVDFLNSRGLGVMAKVRKAVRAAGGDVVLAQPSERVLDTLELTGLDIFKVYPTQEDAVGSF